MRSAFLIAAATVAVTATAFAFRIEPTVTEPEAPRLRPTRARPPVRATTAPPVPRWTRPHISTALAAVPRRLGVVDEPVLAQLPADTAFVGAVENAGDALRSIGTEQLLATFCTGAATQVHGSSCRGDLGDVEKWLDGLPGVELFDPESWGGTGVDLEGSGGLAIVGFGEDAVLVLFATIADHDAFRRSVEALFATRDQALDVREVLGPESDVAPGEIAEPAPSEAAPALVLTPTDENGEPDLSPGVAVVVRGNRAFVVARLDNRDAVLGRAEQIALQGPEDALISDSNATHLIDRLELGSDAVGYLNVRALVAGVNAELDRETQAKREALENGEWDEMDRGWREGQLNELEAARLFVDGLLGSVTGAALGLNLADGKVELEAVLDLEPGSVLGRLAGSRRSTTIRAIMPGAPLFLLDAALDVATVRSLTEQTFNIVGADFKQAMALAQATAGFSGDPFALFTGEFSLAFSPAEAREAPDGPDFMPFEMTAVVDVTNPLQAQAVLDRLGGLATLAGLGEYDAPSKGLLLKAPYIPPFRFAIARRALIVSTSAEAIQRALSGAGGDLATEVDPALGNYLPTYGQSGSFFLDAGMFSLEQRMGFDPSSPPAPEGPGESLELQQARAEVAALSRKLWDEPAEIRRELAAERARLAGAFGLRAVPEESGLRVRAGWVFRAGSLAQVLDRMSQIDVAEQATWHEDAALREAHTAAQERLNILLAGAAPLLPVPIDEVLLDVEASTEEVTEEPEGVIDPEAVPEPEVALDPEAMLVVPSEAPADEPTAPPADVLIAPSRGPE